MTLGGGSEIDGALQRAGRAGGSVRRAARMGPSSCADPRWTAAGPESRRPGEVGPKPHPCRNGGFGMRSIEAAAAPSSMKRLPFPPGLPTRHRQELI